MSGIPGFQFDTDFRTLSGPDGKTTLQGGEAKLLAALVQSFGRLVRHERIEYAIWGDDPDGGPLEMRRNVSVRMHFLRRKLLSVGAPVKIVNVHGSGFVLRGIDE